MVRFPSYVFMALDRYCSARKVLDIVHQFVARAGSRLAVAVGDSARLVGVQARAQRQIGRFAVMHVPETTRKALQKLHRAGRIVVVRRLDQQAIELAVEPHEGDVVIGLGTAVHALRDLQQLFALVLVRPFSPRPAEQALDLAPHLKHQQLIARIDIRDENTLARQYGNQAFACQPLQGFADGSSADFDHRSEEHTSELQSQSNLVCRLLLEKKKQIKKKMSYTHDMLINTNVLI